MEYGKSHRPSMCPTLFIVCFSIIISIGGGYYDTSSPLLLASVIRQLSFSPSCLARRPLQLMVNGTLRIVPRVGQIIYIPVSASLALNGVDFSTPAKVLSFPMPREGGRWWRRSPRGVALLGNEEQKTHNGRTKLTSGWLDERRTDERSPPSLDP